jgi:hypothetical protein
MDKLEEYNPQNLTKRDTDNITTLTNQSVNAISKLIASIQDLNNNINLYKDCMVDYLNITTEILDIQSKYKSNNLEGKGVGSGQLPGLYTQPQSYNMEEVKQDSAKLEALNGEESKVKSQRDNYLILCREDIKLIIEYWKTMNRTNLNFDNYIIELGKIIN